MNIVSIAEINLTIGSLVGTTTVVPVYILVGTTTVVRVSIMVGHYYCGTCL